MWKSIGLGVLASILTGVLGFLLIISLSDSFFGELEGIFLFLPGLAGGVAGVRFLPLDNLNKHLKVSCLIGLLFLGLGLLFSVLTYNASQGGCYQNNNNFCSYDSEVAVIAYTLLGIANSFLVLLGGWIMKKWRLRKAQSDTANI